MDRVEAVNYLLSSGLSGEQIKAVLEPFAHEEAFKKQADIIVYIKANKDCNALNLAEHINVMLYEISAVDDYRVHVLKDVEGDNED